MQKRIVLALSVSLFAAGLQAQHTIEQVLHQVAENNKELRAYQAHMESSRYRLSTGNNLPDPQVSGYYLPFGEQATAGYTEFQVTQSFAFPTVYAARKNLITQQQGQLQVKYDQLRQEVLLKAKKHCQELVFLNKRKAVDLRRVRQAEKIYEQVRDLYEQGQVGVLERNKARIAWMKDQFVVEELDNEIQTILNKLQQLNGGQALDLHPGSYQEPLSLASLDSIWNEKQEMDPDIRALRQREAISSGQVSLAKNKRLPDLTVGFNQQGVAPSTNSGFYGGLSIPLWNNRNQVKAAKTRHQYNRIHTEAKSDVYYTDLQARYNDYQVRLDKYRSYQQTLTELESEALLSEAYQLGEISFIEYQMELQFYREAYDTMLQMEKTLHQQQAEILKHQL